MRRFFLESIDDSIIKITGDEHKHLSIVLRAKKGQTLELTCGDDFIYTGIIKDISKNETIIEIIDKKVDESEPKILVDLYFGIIKGEHLEIAVQKATELGVNRLIPLVLKNVVKKDVNLVRLNKITKEAAKQCGRGKVPKIEKPIEFSDLLDKLNDYDLIVFPYEKETKNGLRQILQGKEKAKNVAIIIGPEGGFAEEEAAALSKITMPISLGKRILRADTACISALSIVMFAFGELEQQNE